MNRPFRPIGLGLPWYSVFGNHDGLVQGNFAQNELFDQVVVGCRKVTRYSREALAQIQPLREGGVTPEERAEIIRITFGDFLDTWGVPREHRGLWKTVPSDPARRFLRKTAWMQEHFRTRGRPRGHGFSQANLASAKRTTPSARPPACASSQSTPSRTTRAPGTSTRRSSAGWTRSSRQRRRGGS